MVLLAPSAGPLAVNNKVIDNLEDVLFAAAAALREAGDGFDLNKLEAMINEAERLQADAPADTRLTFRQPASGETGARELAACAAAIWRGAALEELVAGNYRVRADGVTRIVAVPGAGAAADDHSDDDEEAPPLAFACRMEAPDD